MPGLAYEDQEVVIAPQTTLFLYTDGLTEAENKEKSLFGKERLKMAVCELMAEGDVSAQQLVEKVEEAVKAFVGDAEQSDDLTMLALKYTGLS